MVLIAPLMLEHNNINIFKMGWNQPSFRELFVEKLYFLGRVLKWKEVHYVETVAKNIMKFDIVQGSFFINRRDIFEKIGFFDEGVFMYSEEDILAARIKRLNKDYYAGVCLDSTYVHEHDFTRKNLKARRSNLKAKAVSERYYLKHYSGMGKGRQGLIRLASFIYINITVPIGEVLYRIRGLLKPSSS